MIQIFSVVVGLYAEREFKGVRYIFLALILYCQRIPVQYIKPSAGKQVTVHIILFSLFPSNQMREKRKSHPASRTRPKSSSVSKVPARHMTPFPKSKTRIQPSPRQIPSILLSSTNPQPDTIISKYLAVSDRTDRIIFVPFAPSRGPN
jgi:hypothetical protein